MQETNEADAPEFAPDETEEHFADLRLTAKSSCALNTDELRIGWAAHSTGGADDSAKFAFGASPTAAR